MPTRLALTTILTAVVVTAGGCASKPTFISPDTPAALRVPPEQVVFLEAVASGVQIYECVAKPDHASQYEWIFRAPEATLADRSGRPIGTHFAGPTWASYDGSSVLGELRARDPGPSPSAIPWLLLTAKSTTGDGLFSSTKSVQRLHTAGGLAPSEPCGMSDSRRSVRVPYTATYYFYREAR
jgi:hypothetical protein